MLVGSGQNPSWATRLKFPTDNLLKCIKKKKGKLCLSKYYKNRKEYFVLQCLIHCKKICFFGVKM